MKPLLLDSRQVLLLLRAADHMADGVRGADAISPGMCNDQLLGELATLREILVVAYAGPQ